jgi:aldehyde:ferredoxin oxidoreductase
MKILRVNMSYLSLSLEPIPKDWTIIGGRALTVRILTEEVLPSTDPLGPEAKLVLACGPLAGTRAPSCGRLSIGAKSPLTSGIKEANSGGPAAQKLDRLGIRAIVIEGKPNFDELFLLRISGSYISLASAQPFAGLKNYPLAQQLTAAFGQGISMISIGIAGERKWKAASITLSDKEGNSSRHAARGGLGAVMGTKGLKAIIIDDKDVKPVAIANKAIFCQAVRDWKKVTQDDLTLKELSRLGTPGMISTLQHLKSMPVNNYQAESIPGLENISGEAIRKINRSRGGQMQGCMPGCLVKCSIRYLDKQKKYKTSNLQYQSIAMLGSNLGITDPDVIAELDFLCDDLGIDSIELGSALGIAATAGLIKMGDPDSVLEMIRQVEQGTRLGTLLASGVEEVCRTLGVTRIPAIKGQAIPAHDPRIAKTAGVSYLTSPMGADHTAGVCYDRCQTKACYLVRSKDKQVFSAVVDACGFCLLAAPGDQSLAIEFLTTLINARYDLSITPEDLAVIGRETLKSELEFNRGSGFHSEHEPDPEYLRNEAIGSGKQVFDMSQSEIDSFWFDVDDRQESLAVKPQK